MNQNLRILLIEDENLAARRLEKLVTRALEPACLSVTRCLMPEEAQSQLTMNFDLILLDLNLCGFNTMEWLRKGEIDPHRTFVITAEPAFEREALNLGVRRYLLKPIDECCFRAAVADFFPSILPFSAP